MSSCSNGCSGEAMYCACCLQWKYCRPAVPTEVVDMTPKEQKIEPLPYLPTALGGYDLIAWKYVIQEHTDSQTKKINELIDAVNAIGRREV